MILNSQAEIARQLDCTRSNIGQTLKRSIRKMYKTILREQLASSPFEAFERLTAILELEQEEDINEFYNTMPKKLQEEIREDVEVNYM